ncbi:uncharacterized protein LOC120270560 isoform X2 [Dioscorea cayenensis subsp. rotundata]|uniref:Uncharacterized protein LOC120270560 isoform X2 n=1 Tax=Dioscorea cayennensis subsp. rotundata TaxID=55577 RepID=A0AB40C1A5_DIOCR|nr:uncharacterized protein LOC120270560 isoform X2 [Dioscorea cayenensis subsp. rotundata]
MGGKQSKEAERRSETSSPDPVIPKKNDAESQATPPKEQLQTNASSTAVATSPLEAAVHEESQAQDKGQPNIVQTEVHQPDFKRALPPPPAGIDKFPNVTGPDTSASRRQDQNPHNYNNNNDGIVPPQQNFHQPDQHGWDHMARRDSRSNWMFDHNCPYPYNRDQEFYPVPPHTHGDQYHGQDQYWPRNDHIGRQHPLRDGREYLTDDAIQNREKRSSSSGDKQSGTLVYDNIVICEDPSKVVMGIRNSAGGKVGGRVSGNRVIR